MRKMGRGGNESFGLCVKQEIRDQRFFSRSDQEGFMGKMRFEFNVKE